MTMLLKTLLVVGLVWTTEGLRCYQCDGMDEIGDCTSVDDCTDNQSCYTEKYTDDVSGESFFRLGCLNKTVCPRSPTSGSSWSSCCNSNYCNIDIDNTGRHRVSPDLRCLSCPNVDHPRDCNHVQVCRTGQECIAYSKSHGGRTTYALGCRSKTSCDSIRASVVMGKRAVTTSGCKTCCSSGSLCNGMLCTTSPTTTLPPPTTPTSSQLHLVVSPSEQTAEEGAMIKFECNFDTPVNQSMNMSWTFTNSSGDMNEIYSSSDVQPPEIFINVKEVASSDAGVYTCVVEEGSRSWTSSGRLHVQDPSMRPTILPQSMNVSSWKLDVIPKNQTIGKGETAILLCQFDKPINESMTMTWLYTDQSGQSSQIFTESQLTPSMTFYVKQLETTDEGTYTCEAKLGSLTWTANSTLTVHD